jgi:hypothetical protein
MPERRPRVGPVGVLLVLLMAVGSIVMWLGAPVGLIWLAGRTASPANPTLGPLLIIAGALPVTMIVIAIVLRRLDAWFSQVTGYDADTRRIAVPWMKGMTERRDNRRATVLDVVMIMSVIGAGAVVGFLWLFVAKPF